MTKWSYKVTGHEIKLSERGVKGIADDIGKVVNRYGGEGWELIISVAHKEPDLLLLFFKRPVT
ncbi:MAG: hypothetical protein ABSA52_07195 [Candidatus Binatia bacterium]|jgi:hypothetical protein